jgi:recombination protein RecT
MGTQTQQTNTAALAPTGTTTQQAPARAITLQDRQRASLRALLAQQRPELAKVLPKGMSADRLERIVLTEVLKNPKLLECSQESWALAIQTCGAQGLYPDGVRGEMYLIPRNNRKKKPDGSWYSVMEVTAQRGYQGDITLARRSGEIADIYAEVVYEKDRYKVTKGLNRSIEHEPADVDDPGPLKAAYAVAKLKSGETAFVTLTKRDVMRHKAASTGTDSDDSPWKKHEAAMWRKSAVRELFKWLPWASEQAQEVGSHLLAEDHPTIETTATTVESLPPGPDPLMADVIDTTATTSAPGCSHPGIATRIPFTPPTKVLVCLDCAEEVHGTGDPEPPAQRVASETDREPGADDDAPISEAMKETFRRLDAEKAGARRR